MSATVRDIARQVGLSVTTVSRALNDHDDVAPATKARIRDVARRLDYHPNAAARSLQNKRSGALGLVIPLALHRFHDTFWLEFIGGMAAACARQGADLLLNTAEGTEDVPAGFRRLVHGHRVDGLVLCDVRTNDARVAYLRRLRIPFVAFGRTAGDENDCYIDVDGTAGVFEGMMHLILLGHQRIAYLGLDPAFGFSRFRLAGYREALSRSRLPYDPELVFEGVRDAAVPDIMESLFSLARPPTAIVTAADFLALAVLRAASRRGLAIPADLSVIAFDDNQSVQRADPPLTAIGQPNWRLGEEAGALLLARVDNSAGPVVQRLVVPTLTIRSSTGPARREREGETVA